MPDVVDFLLNQHEEVRSLFKEVQSSTGADKKDAFNCLVNLLAVHETAEEMVVYPVLRSSGDVGDRLADARTDEESKAKDALSDLEKIGPDSREFDSRFIRGSGFGVAGHVFHYDGAKGGEQCAGPRQPRAASGLKEYLRAR